MKQCEFEDSMNCVWYAHERGNGEGQSFVDIEGETHYLEVAPIFKEDGWLNVPSPPLHVVCAVDPSWWECGLFDEVEELIVPEAPEIEVPEAIESVGVTPMPPEYIETGVVELAYTGTAEVVSGALLGIALVITGVVTMMKGRRVA